MGLYIPLIDRLLPKVLPLLEPCELTECESWWEGWKSSDMEVSGERASGGTKQERKASRKETPRPAPLTERSEADDAVVATETRDSSPLPPGSLRLQGEAPPLPLLILEPRVGTRQCTRSAVEAAVACGDEREVVALAACLDGWELEICGLMTTRGRRKEPGVLCSFPARQVGLVRNRTRLLRCT